MRILTMLVAMTILAPAVAADPLDALVSADDAQAMGLQKLSAEERAVLARWIERNLRGQPVPLNTPTVAFSVDGVTLQAQLTPVVATTATAAAAAPAAVTATATSAATAAATEPASLDRVELPVAVGSAGAFGLEQQDLEGGVEEIHARIVGEFSGWEGKTQFTLDNGQVWRQSRSGTYHHKATDPEVVIEKALIGYKLRLVETRRSVPVRRVK